MIETISEKPRLLDPAELDAVSGGLIHEYTHQGSVTTSNEPSLGFSLLWGRSALLDYWAHGY